MKSFVDTNVLVYLFDNDSPQKKAIAQRILQTEGSAGDIVLSTQVLQEFYVTVTRKLATPLSSENALTATSKFASLPTTVIDAPMILSAIRRSEKETLSFWDSLIVETAVKGGAQRILSEDLQHGRIVDGVRIENPFK